MCVSKVCKVNFEPNLEWDARKQVPHSYYILVSWCGWNDADCEFIQHAALCLILWHLVDDVYCNAWELSLSEYLLRICVYGDILDYTTTIQQWTMKLPLFGTSNHCNTKDNTGKVRLNMSGLAQFIYYYRKYYNTFYVRFCKWDGLLFII